MDAALSVSDETVSFLLSLGANPDQTSNDRGHTPLIFAIQSRCITTINLLAPVTKVNLDMAFFFIASGKVDLTTGELRELVKRAVQDSHVACRGIELATTFGFCEMIELIAQNAGVQLSLEINQNDCIQGLWLEAVKSDSEATVSALLQLLPRPSMEAITLAWERGVPGVVRLLLPNVS